MRRFFTTLLIAATMFATGCDKDDESTTEESNTASYVGVEYKGTLSVSKTQGGEARYTQEASVYLDIADDAESATITFAKIIFDEAMISNPGYLDIMVKDVPAVFSNYYTNSTTTYNIDGEDIGYTFTDLTISNSGILEVSFEYYKYATYYVTFTETAE